MSHQCFAVNCGAPLPKVYSAAKTNAKVQCLINAVTALQAAPVATPVVQQTNSLTVTVAAATINYSSSSDLSDLAMTLTVKNKSGQTLRIQALDRSVFSDNMNGKCSDSSPNGITTTFNINDTTQSNYTLLRAGAALTMRATCSTFHSGIISPKASKLSLSQNFLIYDSVNGNHVEAVAFTDISPK